jgi:hypothetical protein
MLSMDHVVILYKSKQGTCRHCIDVSNIWDNPPPNSVDGLSISAALKKVNPKVRFVTVTATNNQGHFDNNLTPKDLIRYGVRFPQIILVPGKLWDEAMDNLGPNNDVKLLQGVKVINYNFINDRLQYEEKYNIKMPSDYEKWYKSCIEEENSSVITNEKLTVPIKSKNIFVESPIKNIETKNKKEYTISEFSNVCSIQLVSKNKK